MSDAVWRGVDQYFEDRLVGEDEPLSAAMRDSAAAGLPAIAVSAAHGKLLNLLAMSIGAKRILEIGTLGGYSAIWMARALPADGKLVTLEIDPCNADVARSNVARAGLGERVDIRVGPPIETLPTLQGPFDMAFIDADKESNTVYFDHAVRLSRPGGIIVVDNVVRDGRVIDAKGNAQVQGVRRMMDAIHADARVSATAVQPVGVKGYDGFLMAVVR